MAVLGARESNGGDEPCDAVAGFVADDRRGDEASDAQITFHVSVVECKPAQEVGAVLPLGRFIGASGRCAVEP